MKRLLRKEEVKQDARCCKAMAVLLAFAYASAGQADPEKVSATPASVINTQAVTTSKMTFVPAGEFVMGSDKEEKSNKSGEFGNTKPWYLDEHPEQHLQLPDYYIDTYEVTNGQYRGFVMAVNAAPPEHWVESGFVLSLRPERLSGAPVDTLRKVVTKVLQLDVDTRMLGKDELMALIDERFAAFGALPVTFVKWSDANAYCAWTGKQLPSEAQWEKAARGSSGAEFPWGNDWKKAMSNTGGEAWDDGVAPVGSYDTDKSPFGVYDMAGNVSEWVANWYEAYPGSTYKNKTFGETFRVARGAGWGGSGHYALQLFQRGAYRMNLDPDMTYNDVGFRCAKEPAG